MRCAAWEQWRLSEVVFWEGGDCHSRARQARAKTPVLGSGLALVLSLLRDDQGTLLSWTSRILYYHSATLALPALTIAKKPFLCSTPVAVKKYPSADVFINFASFRR